MKDGVGGEVVSSRVIGGDAVDTSRRGEDLSLDLCIALVECSVSRRARDEML